MGIIILIIVAIIMLIISVNSDGYDVKTNNKDKEEQQQDRLKKEQAEHKRLEILKRQQQIEREQEIELKSQQAAEQLRLKKEKENAAEQQLIAAQHRAQELRQQLIVEEQIYRNICEVNTAYSTDLQILFRNNPAGFGFSTIRSICRSQSNEVMQQLRQGVAQLTTYEQLCQYIFAYGKMHSEKLRQAFQAVFLGNHLPLPKQNLEIIDYGCGQGLGTVCLIDYLKTQMELDWIISKVKLIEPSELALKRGALNVRYSLRSTNQTENVFAIRRELDDLLPGS